MKRLQAQLIDPMGDPAFPRSVAAVLSDGLSVFNSSRYTVFPGFCDVHVHFREPGFSYKETIASGSAAAARGGYSAVCTMPNLDPVPDNATHLRRQLELIEENAYIRVYPYGAITQGEKGERLSDMAEMAEQVVGFSDDGRGVQCGARMQEAMRMAARLGKPIAAHCEDNTMLHGGYIHDGAYARAHGHRGISAESEWMQIERDLALLRETGAKYHVCHISTAKSVELIRRAKAQGLDVTCETAPHYLVLDDSCLQEDGRFKMNPPLRTAEDRQALLQGVRDGTIDMLATDHAPHSVAEKSGGLRDSAFGVVGLETAFPVCYTELVRPGLLSMERLMQLMVVAPRKRFRLPMGNDFSVWDLQAHYRIDPARFASMGRATPFAGRTVYGRCVATVCDGRIVYFDHTTAETQEVSTNGKKNGH